MVTLGFAPPFKVLHNYIVAYSYSLTFKHGKSRHPTFSMSLQAGHYRTVSTLTEKNEQTNDPPQSSAHLRDCRDVTVASR